MTDNEITYQIRGAIFDVYNESGPGLLESVYEEALVFELLQRGLKVERQVEVPIRYKGTGLLVNFSDENIRDGIQRIVN